jgi:hypothetical protein
MLFAFAVAAANAEPVGVHFMSQRGSAQAGTDTMQNSFSAISEITQSSFFETAVMAVRNQPSGLTRKSIDELQITPRADMIASLDPTVVASHRDASGAAANVSSPNVSASTSSANSAPNVAANDSNSNAATPDIAAQLIEDASGAVSGGTDPSIMTVATTSSADVTSADVSSADTASAATPASVTPEPSTMALVGSLLIGLGVIRIKRNKRN